jgi:hypothetical protein
MATTDNMALRYFVESAYGEASPSPAPTLNTLLVVSESLTTNFQTIESEAVVGDRQVQDIVRVGKICEGDINTELNYGNLDDFFRGGLAGAWVTDLLENGSTLVSYGLEKEMSDLGIFYRFVGARVNTLAINMALQSMITGTVGVMAKGGVFANSTFGDGSPVDATTNPSMVTLSTLTLNEGGTGLACPTSFNFQFNNELRQKRCLGEDDISGINLGIFRASGTLEAYFEDRTYVDKLIADTPSDFEIIAQDSDGNSYTFTFPRFKFQTLDGPANTGRSQDVMQTLTWTAYKDPSSGITASITRAAA